MTREQIEMWSFVFNGLTAVGTLGAVIISLWLTLRKPPSFEISDIQVERIYTMGNDNQVTNTASFLTLKIENLKDTRLQIFHVAVKAAAYKDAVIGGMLGQSIIVPFRDTYIPHLSRYSIRAQLAVDVEPGTFSIARKIECEVSTSSGDKIVMFPKTWINRLSEAVEREDQPAKG